MDNERYLLNPYIKFIVCNDDEILIKHGVRSSLSIILKDKERKRLLGKIEKFFKVPSSIEDIVKNYNLSKEEEIILQELIKELYKRKFLIKEGEDTISVYFKTFLNDKVSISEHKIGVIGTGFLGSRIIYQLLQIGIKHIFFYDERKVENESLEQQYFDIDRELIKNGLSYVEILKIFLSKRGYDNFSGIESSIEDEEKTKELFNKSDLIIVNSECYSPKLFHLMNKLSIETKKTWMSVYFDGSLGVIGPIYIPGESLCYNEFEIQMEATLRHRDEYILYKDYLEEKGICLSYFVIPPLLNIISGYTVFFTVRFLINGYSALNDRAIFINFEDISIDYQNVMKLPRCPVCESIRPVYKHSFTYG